jgi:outer membrane protein assembly factor BamD
MKNIIILGLSLLLLSCATLNRDGWQAKQYYDEGRELINSGSYTIGIETLNEMQTKFSYGIYTEYAWLEKSYAYLQSDSPSLAQIEINEFLRNYPHHSQAGYAFFMLAFSEEAKFRDLLHRYANDPAKSHADSIKQALLYYQQFVRRFPQNKHAPYARKAIVELTNLLAKHEIFIAQSYKKLFAWVAMIKRAEYVLKQYPKSNYTDDALLLIRDGYKQLGLPKIAKEVEVHYQKKKKNSQNQL